MNKRLLILVLILGAGIVGLVVSKLRTTPYPPHADILIFSPHPDDAALCCAGVIQQALAKQKTVLVVNITNGDDFASAAAKLFSKPQQSLTKNDMIRFAGIRQTEDLKALRILGLSSRQVIFLGYPDGALDDVYHAENAPYFHKLTKAYTTYTARVRDYHSAVHRIPAAYTELSVLADITEIIQRTNPSEIYVTSGNDQALDHQAAFWFVRDAVRGARYTGNIFTAVIHTPKETSDSVIGAGPIQIPLTPEQMQVKRAALEKYQSQLILNDFPIFSFVKNEEIFW